MAGGANAPNGANTLAPHAGSMHAPRPRPFGTWSAFLSSAGAARAIYVARCKLFWAMLMLQIMHEATTAELAEILSVTRKTIALWTQQGIMVKLRHGVFDLKESLKNWSAYQRCIFEGAADPLL